MIIYCIAGFKEQFDKLRSKNSYSSIEPDIIHYFFDKTAADLSSGTRLNNSSTTPYIKKRLGGRGGFRFYYLLLIKEENVYLMFVHPKSGSMGYDNIKDESIAWLYKQVLAAIQTNTLFELTLNEEKTKLDFKKVTAPAKSSKLK